MEVIAVAIFASIAVICITEIIMTLLTPNHQRGRGR
jgi:hypothetical protein